MTYHLTLLNSRVYIEDKAPKKADQTAGAPEQASAEENAAALHELATTGLNGRNNGSTKMSKQPTIFSCMPKIN
ncbi:MAG: hypothetical protein IPL33_14875 [Sphingobacteriales bacterium]|nr:hypothetical protein [Sphingobacteriales bacterium]